MIVHNIILAWALTPIDILWSDLSTCLLKKQLLFTILGYVSFSYFVFDGCFKSHNTLFLIRTMSLDVRLSFLTISSTYGPISKLFSANCWWAVLSVFNINKFTYPPLIMSRLAFELRTIEPQAQINWFLYNKRVCLWKGDERGKRFINVPSSVLRVAGLRMTVTFFLPDRNKREVVVHELHVHERTWRWCY